MRQLFTFFIIVFLFFTQSSITNAQDTLRPYINVGYVTSIIQPSGRSAPDSGGSVRVGLFTKSRFGPYIGYVWFKEHETGEYYDKGSLFIGGADYRILRNGKFELYAKLGLIVEKYISVYSNRDETETSLKPDFGLLFNISHLNIYTGWQPSDPSHYNFGIGYTF
jgi:hypothetical protein